MKTMNVLARYCLGALFLLAFSSAFAQSDCKNRGDLDAQYCDENKDLVADLPKDSKRFKTPKDRKSTRLNSSHSQQSRMPSSA